MDFIVREELPKKVSLFLHSITIIMVGLLTYVNYNQSKDITTLNYAIIRNDPINLDQTNKISVLNEFIKSLEERQRIL